MNKSIKRLIILLFIIIISTWSYFNVEKESNINNEKISYEMSNIPEYNKEVYVEINNNIPQFTNEDINLEEDYYSKLENGKVRNGNNKN